MKVLKLVLMVVVIVVSLLSISCTTNVEPLDPAVLNPNINPNLPTEAIFKVDFSNQTYTTTIASAVISETTITIGALDASGKNFTINLTGTTIGDYATTDQVAILYKKQVSDIFGFVSLNTLGSTANVNVASINNITKRIKGTFKFIGKWNDGANATPPAAIQFINGSFDIPFTTTTVPINAGSFQVDIDGQTITATDIQAVKTISFDNVTNLPLIDPITGLVVATYAISGKVGTTKIFSISFFNTNLTTISFPEYAASASYIPNALNPLSVYSSAELDPSGTEVGQINITTNDETNKKLTGTFNSKVFLRDLTTGMVSDTKIMTNGKFTNVTYIIN
jgi:hypothetical protein